MIHSFSVVVSHLPHSSIGEKRQESTFLFYGDFFCSHNSLFFVLINECLKTYVCHLLDFVIKCISLGRAVYCFLTASNPEAVLVYFSVSSISFHKLAEAVSILRMLNVLNFNSLCKD